MRPETAAPELATPATFETLSQKLPDATIPQSVTLGWPPDPPQQVIDITRDLQQRSDAGEDVPSDAFQWRGPAGRIITDALVTRKRNGLTYGELVARRSREVAK